MDMSERIDAALRAQMVFPPATCKCCRPPKPYRPRIPVPQGEDPEGDKALAYWERKLTTPGFKPQYDGLTFEQKRAMLGKKKAKNWKGGGHAP